MYGKANNASVRPSGLGTTLQSSVYGSCIPNIYGRTRCALSLIWANNLKQAGTTSGKKGKSRSGDDDKKDKGKVPVYTEAVDFLIGSNPVVKTLQFWANQNERYPLLFTSRTETKASGASQTITWADSLMYCLIGVTVTCKYDVTFDDYGGTGELPHTGEYEVPMWNAATAGPDPSNPHFHRFWPFCYYWLPGTGCSIKVPGLETGAFADLVTNPASILFTIYFARLYDANSVPTAKLRLTFEPQLGSGSEYDYNEYSYPDNPNPQQIIYPPFAGVGSPNLDLGSGSGSAPNIRPEVLGLYPLHGTGDADFVDIVEDIFKAGLSQSAYGCSPPRSIIQRCLPCYDYPGTVQRKAYSSANASVAPITSPIFDIGTTKNNVLVVAASAVSGWLNLPMVSDAAGNSWTSIIGLAEPRLIERQIWWAVAKDDQAIDQVTLNIEGSDADLQMFEIGGVNSLDDYWPLESDGTPGLTKLTQDITLNRTADGQGPWYVLSWLFMEGTKTPLDMNPRTPLLPLVAQAGSRQRADFFVSRNPGTFTLTYDVVSGNLDGNQVWSWMVLVFRASQPADYAKPFGNILDPYTLEQTRKQCWANGLWGSLSMDAQKKGSDWLEDLCISMNAAPVWSGFRLKLIPRSEVSRVGNGAIYESPTADGPLATMSEADFISETNEPPIVVDRVARVDTPNLLQVQHPNRLSDYADVTSSLPDSGSVAQYGALKDSPKVLRSIQDDAIARMILGIMVRRQNVIRYTLRFKLQPRWKLLEPMDLIQVPRRLIVGVGETNQTMLDVRITSIDEDEEMGLDVVAEPFIYGLHAPIQAEITDHLPYDPGIMHVPQLVNEPVFLEPTNLYENVQGEVWVAVSDIDPLYGGCQVYASTDGGLSYHSIGQAVGNALTGVTTAEWAAGTDPDTVNDLSVDLSECLGILLSYNEGDEESFTFPCFVEGGNLAIPYELMCYAVATLTSPYHFTLEATGGRYLRRGVHGTPMVTHPSGSRFAFLSPADVGIFKYKLDPHLIGTELWFKFPAFNKYGHGLQDLADCTAYPYTPGGTWNTEFAPDNLYVNAIASGQDLLFGCLARRYNASVDFAEFRAKWVTMGENPDFVDLRTPEEGGTLVHDGTHSFVVTGIGAGPGGAQQLIAAADVGRWYYAWKLHGAKGGWSIWSDGNLTPSNVNDWVETEDPALADDGPPSDWTGSIRAGAVAGTVVPVASRPTVHGHKIIDVVFQVKDATVGSPAPAWRALDENAGAAVTFYDGSGEDHVYNKTTGIITCPMDADLSNVHEGDLILMDSRDASAYGYAWDVNQTGWGTVPTGSIVLGGGGNPPQLRLCYGFRPQYVPTGGEYQHTRIKIVKAPWAWNTEGYFGDTPGSGISTLLYWQGGQQGDTTTQSFVGPPITLPAGVAVEDCQLRIWFGNLFCRSDDGYRSPFAPPAPPVPPDPGVVVVLVESSTITLDCGVGNVFYIDLDRDITLANFLNPKHGRPVMVIVRQDNVGGHAIVLDSKFTYGTEITSAVVVIDTAAYARNYFGFVYDGDADQIDLVAFTSGYKRP